MPGDASAPEEEMDPDPEHHLPTDRTIDVGSAADIARSVAASAWIAATG